MKNIFKRIVSSVSFRYYMFWIRLCQYSVVNKAILFLRVRYYTSGSRKRNVFVYSLKLSPMNYGEPFAVILLCRHMVSRGNKTTLIIDLDDPRDLRWELYEESYLEKYVSELRRLYKLYCVEQEFFISRGIKKTLISHPKTALGVEPIALVSLFMGIPTYSSNHQLVEEILLRLDSSDNNYSDTFFMNPKNLTVEAYVPEILKKRDFVAVHVKMNKGTGWLKANPSIDSYNFHKDELALTLNLIRSKFKNELIVLLCSNDAASSLRAMIESIHASSVVLSKDLGTDFASDISVIIRSIMYFQIDAGGLYLAPLYSKSQFFLLLPDQVPYLRKRKFDSGQYVNFQSDLNSDSVGTPFTRSEELTAVWNRTFL